MKLSLSVLAALLTVSTAAAHAQTMGFVANPTTNSTDFSTYVTAHGGVLDTQVNFDAHPAGALQSNFYLNSDGVTLTGTSLMNQVASGAGPGQGNTFSGPLSTGEGAHAPSNYLYSASPGTGGPQSLTVSFTTPVSAVGLFTLDYFGPMAGTNNLIITAYSGANGTGSVLGTYTGVHDNFQENNLYFMGLATTDGSDTIGSFVFSRPSDYTGDVLGLDNIEFARNGVPAVPEPGACALAAGFGLSCAGLLRHKRSR